MATITATEPALTPLEQFIRDYVESVGGEWDRVEPQVYDLLLPAEVATQVDERHRDVLRVAFDPEAVPEHPDSQLASPGSPLVDRMLADAMRRGARSTLHLLGLNLRPADLPGRLQRAVRLAPESRLYIERVRAMIFPQAVFWFEASFISDQKEQEIIPLAIDLHHGREVRHIERLLDESRLSDTPADALADAPYQSLYGGYLLARSGVARTALALGNQRNRDLQERVDRQIRRMVQYYQQLREEARELAAKRSGESADPARLQSRLDAIDREQLLRTAELRQKSQLRITMRLIAALTIRQPKLLVTATLESKRPPPAPVRIVWDPLTEAAEAMACPQCGQGSFDLWPTRDGRAVCEACAAAAARSRR